MKAYNLKGSLSTKILPFAGLHFIEFSETVSYEINFVSQSLYLEVHTLLLSKFWVESEILIFVYDDLQAFILWFLRFCTN